MTSYMHTCLSCGENIPDPEEEEQVEGFANPARYRHKDYSGCSAAMQALPLARGTVKPHRTLDQIEKIPDRGHWK